MRHSFPYKTGHSSRSLSARHQTFQNVPLSEDAVSIVIDFDLIDNGAKVGAAERDRPLRCLLPHEAGERVDLLLSHARVGAQRGERSLQRGLRVIELVLIGQATDCSRRSSGRRTAN